MAAVAQMASSAFTARGGLSASSSKKSVRAVRAVSRGVRAMAAGATPASKANIVVFGGTGGTGSECVFQALKRGAKVTVLARTPSKMVYPPGSGGAKEGQPFSDPNLTMVQGDVNSAADIAKVITADTTGVVISLGGKSKDVGKTMLNDGTLNVINGMKAAGVTRVSVVTSIGAGDSADQAPFMFKILMSTVMRSIFTDKNNQEQLFLAPAGPGNGLEFCIVRPGGLGTGPPTGVINVIAGEAGSIARADVADFCLGVLFEETFPYLGQAPCISSVGGTSWMKDGRDGMVAVKK
eukprot:CAMPEP_0197596968 /NCGR_PEP_ID=MMETSP1326-20131121/26250_1 /TAXON_ID=1155430 /ORGANISM="Genus nov. species nov., Strain RCC2288" /LENGTH=293 /DNA_ID=CAMNT_0043163563 /DNA_START=121 /DNA_END=1002 /DNA_ORIENTATION=-